MMVAKKTPKVPPLYMRMTAQEWKVLQAIRDKRGLQAISETVRLMIREAAQKEGITA